jgi:hypothetical protein
MSKTSGPYYFYKRRDTKKYLITLYPASGLPPEICRAWTRKSFASLPLELAIYRKPKTDAEAKTGAQALIERLKDQMKQPDDIRQTTPQDNTSVGVWLERFIALENNPRANRLIGKKKPKF